jgi:hypothetical protein
MKPSRTRALSHRLSGQSQRRQLPEREDAMLLGSKGGNRCVDGAWLRNVYSWSRFSANLGHRPMVARKVSAVGDAV